MHYKYKLRKCLQLRKIQGKLREMPGGCRVADFRSKSRDSVTVRGCGASDDRFFPSGD